MKLLALIKKEFFRFFHDPRLIVTMLLPGVLIFILYSVLGNFIWGEEETTYDFKVYLSGESCITAQIDDVVEASGYQLEWLPAEDAESAKNAVQKGEATAYLVFSEEFDERLQGGERPSVELYALTTDGAGATFSAIAEAVVYNYGMNFTFSTYGLDDLTSMGEHVMAGLLPFLIVIFVFSACMSVTLESVAGEKERGTLSTILVTSVPRSHVALGKIIPLSCISMIGAASSFLGVVLSMPKLMGVSAGFLGGYPVWSYFLILALIISVVPLIVSAISVVSAWSKSVKEASGYTSVLMILVMVLSIVAAFVSSLGEWIVAVPVLNAVVVIQQILMGSLPVWQTFVSLAANVAYTAALVFGVTKMLSSEKIMFGK